MAMDPTQTDALLVRSLSKSYRLGDSRLPVLRELDLRVDAGEMVVVMGPSGSGKTTLLNCISGIDTPDAGSIAIGEERIDTDSEAARTRLRREKIGIVFQFFNLIPTLTVQENVALPLLIGRSRESLERVEPLLADVGLAARAGHYPHQLSGGEMQLASLARALVHQPAFVLADEPTGNVNPAVARSIMQVLRGVATHRGTGLLMVTHSPEHAAWADRICFLKGGQIADELEQGRREDDVSPVHQRLLELGI